MSVLTVSLFDPQVSTLYAMAKQAKNLRGFKLARYAYEKLQALRIPPRFQEAIDLGSVTIRSKPFHDSEVSMRMCFNVNRIM